MGLEHLIAVTSVAAKNKNQTEAEGWFPDSKQKVKKMSSIKDFFTCATERGKYYELLLSGDVETNPGPTVVNPTKTISALYNQSNAEVFGIRNAGRQKCYVVVSSYGNPSVRRVRVKATSSLLLKINTSQKYL